MHCDHTHLPLVAPPSELEELGVVFAVAVVKPFTAEQVGSAIEKALCDRGGCHRCDYAA
jgi:hypothetical protein